MKVWLINPNGPIPSEGWRDYRFTMLGKALAGNGHDVIWWAANFSHHFKRFRSKTWEDIPVASNFRIRLVPTTGYEKNISLGRVRYEVTYAKNLYRRAVEISPPEFIIGTDPPQTIGYVSLKLSKQLGVPLILDVFDQWPELFLLAFPRILRPLAPLFLSPFYLLRRHNLRNAIAVTALCDTYLEVAKRVAPKFRQGKSLTVFNGIDVNAFRSMFQGGDGKVALALRMGKNPGDVWVIYAGTLGNNYDVLTLLKSAFQLMSRGSRVKILVAGDGPLRPDLTDFIQAHQLTSLIYLGKLSHEELIRVYQVCDIGLCPYAPGSNVAMPDKAYDYMAAGLPIVNSLKGELESFIRDKNIGVQYSAGDPVSLADALESLARDGEKRSVMARNSCDAAMMFDQHVQYKKFVEFVEDMLFDKINGKNLVHLNTSL